MTTIAIDHTSIAADGLGCIADEVIDADASKIEIVRESGQVVVYALSGPRAIRGPLIAWEQAGATVPDLPGGLHSDLGWSFVAIKRDGTWFYTSKCPYAVKVKTPFAIGAGADYATGMMHAGKTAEEAIRLIIERRLNVYTGGEVQVVNLAAVFGKLRAVE